MSSVGDVYASLRLDVSNFQSAAAQATVTSKRLEDALKGLDAGRAADQFDSLGDATAGLGGHFEGAGRSIARFSAITLEQLIPGLEGSRTGIEGAIASVGKLGGVYGTAAVGAAGLAAVLGGVLFAAWGSTKKTRPSRPRRASRASMS